jgi:hypothetical protein
VWHETEEWTIDQDIPVLIALVGAAVFALLPYAINIFAFLTFQEPKFVDEANESKDLALCFHLNYFFQRTCFSILKVILAIITLGATVTALSGAYDAMRTLGIIWFSLLTSFVSILFLFPCAKECKLSYAAHAHGQPWPQNSLPDRN